jgi:hypothetical protein
VKRNCQALFTGIGTKIELLNFKYLQCAYGSLKEILVVDKICRWLQANAGNRCTAAAYRHLKMLSVQIISSLEFYK